MINELFNLMDKWRHYPNWQLERRADIFFAMYLKEILSLVDVENIECIIPEFPVRIGEIYDADINKSKKIDYLVVAQNEIILVELKTDNSSRRETQDDYLQRSQEIGIGPLISGTHKIYNATTAKKKYDHLMKDIKVIESKENFENLPLRIVYIQPNGNEANIINFQSISELESINDEIGERFKSSLKEWASSEAGDTSRNI